MAHIKQSPALRRELLRKRIILNPMCPRCDDEVESTNHRLRDCCRVAKISDS